MLQGDDSVIECNTIDGSIKVQQSYNIDGNDNEPIADVSELAMRMDQIKMFQ